jgi:hypothetical protein
MQIPPFPVLSKNTGTDKTQNHGEICIVRPNIVVTGCVAKHSTFLDFFVFAKHQTT